MKRTSLWALGLAVLALGCSTPGPRVTYVAEGDVRAVDRIEEGTTPGLQVVRPETQARLNNVGFLTTQTNRQVAVEGSGANRLPGNTLEVWASFRNRTDYPQRILVRTQYFAGNRTPIEGPDVWQPLYLPSNGIETYKTHSKTTTADFYYIEVQAMP